jgi:PAS domain S-box-containing protein
MTSPTLDRVLVENEELRRRLEEAEEAVRAIRAGEVDAVVVESEREEVYTLETAHKPYRLLVEQMAHAAATLTPEGAILYGNRAFADLVGQPLAGLVGRTIQTFTAAESREALDALLHEGLGGDSRGMVIFQRQDDSTVPVYLGISAVREGALGVCLLVTDLTEQRHYQELQRAQEALRLANERLELAQRAGRIGTFEWDIRTGHVNWSATEEELYGLPAGAFGGRYENWRESVHPDDLPRAEADVVRAVAERTELNTEFRIIRPDGQTRWLAGMAKVFADENGQAQRMLGVNMDITERKKIEEDLKEADRRKNEFLATLAHELRNPLAPIRNAVQVLKAEGSPHADLAWGKDVIDRQVQVMARLLEDLLDVSRISRNNLELRSERIELAAVLEAALETSRPNIQAGGHQLTVTLPPEPVYLDADPVRLAQVFANLLNNAAKYTEDGGRIWLTARRDGAQVVVSVRDTGIGMAPEMLPRVFEIFAQSRRALERAQGGLGIGLSLVKGLVELHGGTIEAHSAGFGRGSEFVVHLPTAAAPPSRPAEPLHPDRELVRSKHRLLIADDNQDITDSLAMVLKIMGQEVVVAYDGEQAVTAFESQHPEIVVLDLGMPRLNGCEACMRIRQLPRGKDAILLAVTGWGHDEDRERTEAAGFDGHLVKPVHPRDLMNLLASLLAARG